MEWVLTLLRLVLAVLAMSGFLYSTGRACSAKMRRE
jgi:hypothetical protein